MVAGDVARVVRAPGRIVIGPTNLSAAYPYGGTEVGKSNACAVRPLGVPFRVECEALGEAIDILEPNNHWVFGCFLRGWDDDAVQQMLAGGYNAGTTTKHAFFDVPQNVPGTSSLGRAVILLYVPDDLIHTPAILIYSGIPDFADGAELVFQRGDELGILLTVDCVRDSSGNMLRIGRLADLSLT